MVPRTDVFWYPHVVRSVVNIAIALVNKLAPGGPLARNFIRPDEQCSSRLFAPLEPSKSVLSPAGNGCELVPHGCPVSTSGGHQGGYATGDQ